MAKLGMRHCGRWPDSARQPWYSDHWRLDRGALPSAPETHSRPFPESVLRLFETKALKPDATSVGIMAALLQRR